MTTQEPQKKRRKTAGEVRATHMAAIAALDNAEAKKTKRTIERLVGEAAQVVAGSAGKPYLPQLQQAHSLLTNAAAQIKVVEVQ